MFELLTRAINLLKKEEKFIIEQLYFDDKTLKDVSKKLNVCNKTIMRKENEILLKLRKLLIDIGGDDYDFGIIY